MTTLRIVLAMLAVWRVTHLLHAEDGPLKIFARCRNWLRRMSLSGATDCFYCLSLWVSAPFAMMLGIAVGRPSDAVAGAFWSSNPGQPSH